MLGCVNVSVLIDCIALLAPLHECAVDTKVGNVSLGHTHRFSERQVATVIQDFCVVCGEYLLFDGYFLNKGM